MPETDLTKFDPTTVSVTVVENVLECDRQVKHTELLPAWGKPLIEVLPERVQRDPAWVVLQNGKVIPREEWASLCAEPGGDIICYSKLGDTNTKLAWGAFWTVLALLPGVQIIAPIGWALFLSGVGMLATGITEALIGPPQMPMTPTLTGGDQESSPTYGFAGIQNSTRVGAPLPVVYGRHSTFPPAEAVLRFEQEEPEPTEEEGQLPVQRERDELILTERAA